MFREALARFRYLGKSSKYWQEVYDEAYHKGLNDGQDFGERIAHNRTLVSELPDILTRYSKLQLKVLNKPSSVMRREIQKFEDQELDRLKMDLQNR